MVGYCSGKAGGAGRYRGITFYFFQAGLLGLTIWNGVTLVLGK
jgi:glutathione S-transferase